MSHSGTVFAFCCRQQNARGTYLWCVKRERERGIKNVFDEIMAEYFLILKKETDIQINKADMLKSLLYVENKRLQQEERIYRKGKISLV